MKQGDDITVAEAGRRLRAGALTSEALTGMALERARNLNSHVHAFVTLTEERALADARRADAELKSGYDRGPLHGIPYALKDIFNTAGIRTTCHSRLLMDNVPVADSVVAARLASGGGVLMGKLATHEFASMGPSFDLPLPPARNPWNLDHVPGGSSSGPGAAVACGMVRIAVGSDTGGSIRVPAAYCGVVGFKPTYGRVSKRGAYPLSYSLDHCGPLARSVEDAAIMLQVIAGHDPDDPGSIDAPTSDYCAALEEGVARLRIGFPRHFYAGVDGADETIEAIDRVVDELRRRGAFIDEVELPAYDHFAACGRVIIAAESHAIHAKNLRQRALEYGDIALQRFAVGAAVSASDLLQAFRIRRELTDRTSCAFQNFDAFITAGTLGTAPRFDAEPPLGTAGSPFQSMPFNVTGHPAMSVPIGLAKDGLPLSLQVVGRHFDEAMVLRVGRSIERAAGWEDIDMPFSLTPSRRDLEAPARVTREA